MHPLVSTEILQGLPALIIGIGTLLAMVSLRNGHLSDRSRACVDELNYKLRPFLEPPLAADGSKPSVPTWAVQRRVTLEEQVRLFNGRYQQTSKAFVRLTAAIVAFAAAAFAVMVAPPVWGVLIIVVGMACLAWGMWTMVPEFLKGTKTLTMNAKVHFD